jgi:hypothetical protein
MSLANWEEARMSPKYEKPKIFPFNLEKYDTAMGANCGSGASASPQCVSGTVAGTKCDTGSTAASCNPVGSAG